MGAASEPAVFGFPDALLELRHAEPVLEHLVAVVGHFEAEVGADHDLADLACGEAAAVDECAGDEQPGTDAVSDRDEHHVACGVSVAVLGEHGDVRVVRDDHRKSGARLQALLEVLVDPAEVRRGEYGSGEVDDTGRADADAEDGSGRERDEPVDERDDLRGRLVAGRCFERDLRAFEDGAVEVEDRATEGGVLAEVDADDLVRGAVDVEQHGRFAGTGGFALARARRRGLLRAVRRRGRRS